MDRLIRSGLILFLVAVTAGEAAAQVPRVVSGAEYKEFSGMFGTSEHTVYTVPQGKTLYLTDIILNRCLLGPSNSTPDLVIMGRDTGQQMIPAVLRIFVPGYQTVCLNLTSPILFRSGEKLTLRVGGNALIEYYLFGYQR